MMLCVFDTVACPPSQYWEINHFQNENAIRLLWGIFNFERSVSLEGAIFRSLIFL